jgi:hypothetical protein
MSDLSEPHVRGMIKWDDLAYPGLTLEFKESIENYLLHGYHPGGFCTAALAGDLFAAAAKADIHNRTVLREIARWITQCAPLGSWGNYEKVENWMRNVDGIRTTYSDAIEKKYIWTVLSAP